VHALDLPGHGKSGGRGRQSVASYSEVVLEWMGAVGIHSAVIAGHSLGGAIALTLALAQPERVSGLIFSVPGRACGSHPRFLGWQKARRHT